MLVGMIFNHATNSLRRISRISERPIVPATATLRRVPIGTIDQSETWDRLEHGMPRHH